MELILPLALYLILCSGHLNRQCACGALVPISSPCIKGCTKLDRIFNEKSEKSPNRIAELIIKFTVLVSSKSPSISFHLPIRYGSPILYDGDHTECALLQFVQDLGRSYDAIRYAYPCDSITKTYHFNTERKYMMTVVPRKTGGYRLFVKGAPEVVLKKCQFYCGYGGKLIEFNSESKQKYMSEVVDPMTEEGLRVIAIAYRDFVQKYAKVNQSFILEQPDWDKEETIFSNLTLLAMMGIADPMRPEVPVAVARCRMAGIFVCLLTGENLKTAKLFATQCGIIKKRSDLIMEASEFNQSIRDSSGEVRQSLLDSLWPYLRVVARCSSMDKYHMVLGITNSLNAGESQVAAVLGDGLGDIPALEQSDVAFSKKCAQYSWHVPDTIKHYFINSVKNFVCLEYNYVFINVSLKSI
ncbi:plasma membrane calcium-transporting ATPase 4-like [Schistocerca gregaria]|uniref:plasma membrane calcium-transporting ATPase 4-like n=1 Tax=Schistocerca gregaria TaxID=7010 RepID=UPI00211EA398|nr:plasma membrane calcium-transporting ATPase 4-like [Schistocerca gregaria]